MGAAKIIGGILALAGGVFMLIMLFVYLNYLTEGEPDYMSCWFLNAVIVCLDIIGGILVQVGKRAGGIIAIVAGAIQIIFRLITVYVTW
ncbi:MAG: hypothetical protein LUQ65_03540, partial [Candidatus Helarchaeota archaeon]|nr:hypothetical protein [Candidatus Helarchaeota archaeon]